MNRSVLTCLLLLSAPLLSGQTEKLIVPSDMKQQTIVTEPVTLNKGYLRAGVILDYRVADRFFNSTGEKEYYNTSSWGSQSAYGITLQYGISDRLEIDLLTEYINNLQQTQSMKVESITNTSETTSIKQKGIGLGDSHLEIRYQVIREKESRFSLTGRLMLTIPTGEKNPRNIKSENQYDLPVGDGTYALGLNISARKVVYPYSFSGYLSYTKNFNGSKIFNTGTPVEIKFRLGNLFEAGVSGNLHLNEWIVFGNELNYYHEGEGKLNNELSALMPSSWALSYQPGLIFQVHRFRFSESVRIPLKGLNVPADPLYIIMVQFIF
jgi:hypothetical protein